MDRAKREAQAVPWGLLGMIAAVACVEAALYLHRFQYASDRFAEWSVFGEDIRQRARGVEVLCFGDSLVKVGVLPRVIEARTGLRAYNFALGYGQPPSTYSMLRQALDYGARPKALVVDFKWNPLRFPPSANEQFYPNILPFRHLAELAWTVPRESGKEFAAKLLLSWALHSYRGRDDLRRSVILGLTGSGEDRAAETLAWRHTWDANLGTTLVPVDPGPRRAVDVEDEGLFPYAWRCNPINREYIERFFRLAREHQLPVFWLIPPLQPSSIARLEKNGVDRDYAAFVGEIQAKFPELTVVDGRHSHYDPSFFADPTHLNRDGAEALSIALGDTIRRSLRRGPDREARWVCLPPPDRRESGVTILDIRESREALRRGADTVRR